MIFLPHYMWAENNKYSAIQLDHWKSYFVTKSRTKFLTTSISLKIVQT